MTNSSLPSIDGSARQIAFCERRRAFSFSFGAGAVLDAFDFEPQSVDDSASDATTGSGEADLFAQASALHERSIDGRGQTVAVIDSGVDVRHQWLGGSSGPGQRVVAGWDFAESDDDPSDDGPAGFHGTHVAGILGGVGDDYAGIAPGADLVALRVFDDAGQSNLAWIESALQWVHTNQDAFESPITTVNLSIGAALTGDNQDEAMGLLADELSALREDGILVFAAAGNAYSSDSPSDVMFPASSPDVIAVGSISSDGALSEFSQRQESLLAAPGERIESAVPEHVYGWDGDYDDVAELSGTSQATPQVAAASMLVRQAMIEEGLDPTGEDVLERLRASATERYDESSGHAFLAVDLLSAIDAVDEVERVSEDQTLKPIEQLALGNDTNVVTLDLSDGIHVESDGVRYELNDDLTNNVPLSVSGGAGADTLRIIGSPLVDRLILNPNDDGDLPSQIVNPEYNIALRGFEHVVFEGGGGADRVTMYDGSGDDQLTSQPGYAEFIGIGFRYEVTDVSRVYVHATAGGANTAFLNDSAGDDTLTVRPGVQQPEK